MIVFSPGFGCFFPSPTTKRSLGRAGDRLLLLTQHGGTAGPGAGRRGPAGGAEGPELETSPETLLGGSLGCSGGSQPSLGSGPSRVVLKHVIVSPVCRLVPTTCHGVLSTPGGAPRAASPSLCCALSRVVPVLLPSCAPIPGPPDLASCLAPGSGIRTASSRWGERPPSLSVCACVPCSVSRRKKKIKAMKILLYKKEKKKEKKK